MGSGRDALHALEQLKPLFHPDPIVVDGALENQFTAGPREIQGAGGASYAISSPVLQYLADLPAADWTSVESGCGYSTVVLANVFGTHICVNPDLASNRLVREFVERHAGATGLRHVEMNSDQGLPGLAAEQTRVDLALIDGNHSHPFPLLDFHYMDQMLEPGGRLLVDNTEIDAVQELTEYLEMEPAYELERLIGNCAVYRKVSGRAFGWKSQVLRRSPDDAQAVRRELTHLRMQVAPDLRAALSGTTPIPGVIPAPSETSPQPESEPPRRSPGPQSPVKGESARSSTQSTGRRLRQVLRWYATPSGVLAGAALLLIAVGVAAPGPWRLIGVAGVGLLGVFLPYKFVREQRRADQRLAKLRTDLLDQIGSRVRGEASGIYKELDGRSVAAAKSTHDLDDKVTSVTESLAALEVERVALAARIESVETRLTPSRRFSAVKPQDPRRLELTLRDATTSLAPPPREHNG